MMVRSDDQEGRSSSKEAKPGGPRGGDHGGAHFEALLSALSPPDLVSRLAAWRLEPSSALLPGTAPALETEPRQTVPTLEEFIKQWKRQSLRDNRKIMVSPRL